MLPCWLGQSRNRERTLSHSGPGQIRIIAGQWRGRKLPVADIPGLRPTPDRVRETLFNWLQHKVVAAECLDLFAGTGVLGFEALSRGAKSVTFIDSNRSVCDAIAESAKRLQASQYQNVCADACDWLNGERVVFDLIFLDPPFHQGLLSSSLQLIIEKQCLRQQGLLYIESEVGLELPGNLQMQKQKTAGDVQYGLYTLEY